MKKIFLKILSISMIALISNSCVSQSVTTNQTNLNSVTVNNIKFEYVSSTISNNELTINLLINSMISEKTILIKDQTPSIIDNNGNEYIASDFKIGSKIIAQDFYWGKVLIADLFQDTPIKAEFKFSNVPNDLKIINTLQFNFLHLLDKSGVDIDKRVEYSVRIKKINL